MRMVLVDEDRLPTYLQRAAELEARMLKAAADAGVEAADMPGLRGLCVEAIKAAERHGR